MPKDFDECLKSGGRIKTKHLKNNKYINICYDKKGNSYSGEVMSKKVNKKKGNSNFNKQASAKKLTNSLRNLQRHFNENYHN